MGGKKTVENSRRFEKDRRDKLNVAFMELCKLLPDHDPSITLSKMEILRKAAEYIKYLQDQNDEIMKLGEDLALKNESEKLKKRVANLLLKTKELVDALRCAGVPIPTSKRKKRKLKTVIQNTISINQNKTSDSKNEAKTSKDEATTIKKVKCGCMKVVSEKKPLKESNPTVAPATTIVSVGNSSITSGSSVSGSQWTNHTKLMTVTPTPLISASVMTTRVQNMPVVKPILPSTKNANTKLTTMTVGTSLPNLGCPGEGSNNTKSLPVVRSGLTNVPIVPSTIQTIPIISNNMLQPSIVKEVTSTLVNKKSVNIITTTSSNSVPTQTIVNSKHLITLSQSNIISTPVVAPGIQTVPVLEKNILSNLGPGTLILADGRIMNVPPIVPQILVKPQPTVILMSSTKKKEKIIVPKKRDVTKTTFANKAPIPAIQTFRLESCPKIRPKKKPKAILKKAEKSKIIENDKGPEQAKKKRKVENLISYASFKDCENNKTASNEEELSMQVENKDATSTSGEDVCKTNSLVGVDESITIPSEQAMVGDTSNLPETINTTESLEVPRVCSPSTVSSSSPSAVTVSYLNTTNPTELSDPVVCSDTTETFDTLQDSAIPSLSNTTNELSSELPLQNSDSNRNIEEEKETSKSNTDANKLSEINQSSSQASMVLPPTRVSNGNNMTCVVDNANVTCLQNDSSAVCNQSENSSISTLTGMTSLKTDNLTSQLINQNMISTSCSDANTAYPTNMTEASLPEVRIDTMQESLFVTSDGKQTVKNKSALSAYNPQPQQTIYSEIDLNQDRSANNCYRPEQRLNTQAIRQSETLSVSKSSRCNVNQSNIYSNNSLLSEANQHSKPRDESTNSTEVTTSVASVSPAATNEKMFSNRELMHNELPDLGSNALTESNSMFPQINNITQTFSLSGQEKIIYSQASSFQQENCAVNTNVPASVANSLNIAGNKNHFSSMADMNFSQQQTVIPQLNHSQMNLTTLKSSQATDPFCTNSLRQDALVYSQSNVSLGYSKTSESYSTHPSYRMSGTLLSDKSSTLSYNNTGNKSVCFSSNEKLPCSNSLPLMSPMNQAVSSNANIYPGYNSANFYPTTTVTYSQNSLTPKAANKATGTISDNASKQIVPYNSFNDPGISMGIGDKHFYTQNMSFHHNSITKPNWEKSNCNKTFYNNSSSNLQEDSGGKDKNSSLQFSKTTGLEKPNESQIHSQLMYLGFQNEPVASHAGDFFRDFPPTSTVLQTGCGFNNITTHNSVAAPSKSKNHNENPVNMNPAIMDRNSQEKSYSITQNIMDKNNSLSNMDKNSTRNASFYPQSSQPPGGMGFTCPERLPEVQGNVFETNSILTTKKSLESNCIPSNNFSTEQKSSNADARKSVTSNTSGQVNTSHSIYNNPMSAATFVEGNNKSSNQVSNITLDERRKVNDVQNSYSRDKDVTKNNRFTETAKLVTCNPSDTDKGNTLYSVSMLEKENIAQNNTNSQSVTSKTVDTERNPETSSYNNYVSKSSSNRKNIQNNNSSMNNISHKINDCIGSVQTHYKDYIGNSNDGEKELQENHKIMSSSSTNKSVSTEINSDGLQTFNFTNSNYQKLLAQNVPFSSNSSRVPSTSAVRTSGYANFENVPFDSLNNQFNGENGPIVNTSVCQTQNMNHALQLLPPTSDSEQVATNSGNKTVPVSVMSNSLTHKENHASKNCPPASDSTAFKGDMNTDYLKSKDLERNTFIPINIDDVRLTSDFSSDLFSSLQVPTGGQHSESISPTAAFLLAFPLVSTSRNIENLPDNENHDNQTSTPTTILQIGNIEPPSTEMFHPIEFQKNNKGNNHYEMNTDYIQVGDIHNKQQTNPNYNKTCDKRKDVFTDFSKDQRTAESKSKSKSASNSYSSQSYNYSHYPCNDFQQYCEKEGSQWQQEFPNIPKDQKKIGEKKKDKGVQKGCFYQNYQEYYNYKDKKRKQQNRISVNWMTTPENREQAEYQPKDPEITNSYTGHSSQPVYSTIPIDFPTESFPDFCSSKKTNNYSWSPSKSLLPTLDNHLMLPSTLPTLVGDLALGTSTPSESFKTFEPPKVQPTQGHMAKKPPEKSDDNKKRNEFPKSQANFFSVSQLVDPKSKKQKTSDRNYKRPEKTSKPRANFNCPKRKDDHCMYFEERNNFAANQNQCTEKRHAYKGGSYSAESLIGAQQTEVDFSSNFNYQQNSNYFQSDFATHVDSGQQYGYFQQSHFSGFSHEEYQDFGFGTNQRGLDQSRQKMSGRKDDNYQGTSLIQPQIYPPYSKSIHYNLPSSQLNTNTTTTLTNFNLSTIFPEMNDQRVASSGQTPQQMNPSFSSSQTYRSHLQQ